MEIIFSPHLFTDILYNSTTYPSIFFEKCKDEKIVKR